MNKKFLNVSMGAGILSAMVVLAAPIVSNAAESRTEQAISNFKDTDEIIDYIFDYDYSELPSAAAVEAATLIYEMVSQETVSYEDILKLFELLIDAEKNPKEYENAPFDRSYTPKNVLRQMIDELKSEYNKVKSANPNDSRLKEISEKINEEVVSFDPETFFETHKDYASGVNTTPSNTPVISSNSDKSSSTSQSNNEEPALPNSTSPLTPLASSSNASKKERDPKELLKTLDNILKEQLGINLVDLDFGDIPALVFVEIAEIFNEYRTSSKDESEYLLAIIGKINEGLTNPESYENKPVDLSLSPRNLLLDYIRELLTKLKNASESDAIKIKQQIIDAVVTFNPDNVDGPYGNSHNVSGAPSNLSEVKFTERNGNGEVKNPLTFTERDNKGTDNVTVGSGDKYTDKPANDTTSNSSNSTEDKEGELTREIYVKLDGPGKNGIYYSNQVIRK